MLYMDWMVILCGYKFTKISFVGNYVFLAAQVKNCISRLCTHRLGDPPHLRPHTESPKQGEKDINTAYNLLYIDLMVIFGGHNINQLIFIGKFDF